MSEPTGTCPESGVFVPPEGGHEDLLPPSAHPNPNRFWPLVCFGATCVSTWFVGAVHWKPTQYLTNGAALWPVLQTHWPSGILYMAAIMGILGMHELGHFWATRWHRIPASYPYFLPLPVVPFGTLGAVIGLAETQANRRQLLDLAVAGPLAGLMIAIPAAWIGLESLPDPPPTPIRGVLLQPPLVLQWLLQWRQPEWTAQPGLPLDSMNPWLMAAWVGLWITGLNLLPIGQLDGGHVAYALLGRRAHWLARTLLLAAIGYIVIAERYEWVLMVGLLCFLGLDHPPTAQDELPLDGKRRVIGWMVALLPIVCFTPQPVLVC